MTGSTMPRILLAATLAVTLPLPALGQASFERWDDNGDGKLAPSELPEGARRNFGRADTNGDGFLSREEDDAFRARLRQRRSEAAGVKIIRDLDFAATGNPRQTLDLLLPKDRSEHAEPLPLIAFVHGGGWRSGDKRGGVRRVQPFVAGGDYAAASIGYRLSDEAQWPAQIHDCKAAIRWLRANSQRYGIDPDRIAVWGTSAGGHLVAMLGVTRDGEELEGDIGPHLGTSSEVACVVDFFGPSELLTMNEQGSAMDHDAPGSPESLLVGGPIQDHPGRARNASPITWVSADDAPFLIVHGTEDPLVPYAQSAAFASALEAEGVPAVLLTVKGGGHGKRFGPSVRSGVETFLAHHLLAAATTVEDGEVAAGE